MTDFKEKYGQYAVIIGGAAGLGKATSYKLADNGLDLIVVDRSQEYLDEFKTNCSKDYPNCDVITVQGDLTDPNVMDKIFAVSDKKSVGFLSYVVAFHKFGKLQDLSFDEHLSILNVNVINFIKCMQHYVKIFADQGHGGILNYSSLTGVTTSPYNAEYGAGKAYIKSITQAVAYEGEKEGIDAMVATLGVTLTPTELKNQPGGEAGAAVQKMGMTPEDTVDEIFENFGKVHSYYVGDHPKAQVKKWKTEMTEDEVAAYMGRFYE